MKRIRDKRAQVRVQLARWSAEQKRRRRLELGIRASRTRTVRAPRFRILASGTRARLITAPPALSLAVAPDGTIRFFNLLRARLEAKIPTFVDLDRVKHIDSDAILVLLATMISFKSENIEFSGNFPRAGKAGKDFKRSGFFQALFRSYVDQDSYTAGRSDAIYTHANKNVDSELSSRVITSASKAVWGRARRSQGVQRVLLELMHNTNNHASAIRPGERHWWLSVKHLPREKKAIFTFLDFGIGIFRSLDKKRPADKWYNYRTLLGGLIDTSGNPELLRLILAGKLHQTVTEKPFRGKGLPGIQEAFGRGWISNLRIVTNNVYANVAQGDFRPLKVEFGGTIVAWELHSGNVSSAEFQP